VLVDADELVGAARRLGDPLSGTLAIGVIPTVSPYLLPAAASAIRRAHPGLTVRWLEDKTESLARALHAGNLDAALLALEADLGGPLQREVIGRDPFVLAMPRSHPLAKGTRPARLGDLRGAHLLLLDDGHCLRDQALAVCANARTEELAFRATSLPTLAQMVSAGAGITLLPRMAVATESRRADLAVRPLADERAFRTLALVWRPTSPFSSALRQLAATIRGSFEATERRR
jgi:LysR family hydrogen peroxide-inducible transcriptional activator